MIADGPPRRVLETIADGVAELVVPEPVPDELRRVLEEKLGLAQSRVDAILELVAELASATAEVPDQVEALSGDPDDDRILAAAVAAKVDVLVSGDAKHLLPLGRHGDVRILKPQALLAELAGGPG